MISVDSEQALNLTLACGCAPGPAFPAGAGVRIPAAAQPVAVVAAVRADAVVAVAVAAGHLAIRDGSQGRSAGFHYMDARDCRSKRQHVLEANISRV